MAEGTDSLTDRPRSEALLRNQIDDHAPGENDGAIAAPGGGSRPYGPKGDRDVVGTRVPRLDARAKVTGGAQYTADIRLPGMLYAAVLRSPHASATVVDIDATAAGRLPGVRGVLTFSGKRIRYAGDEVAAVAADTLEQALDAIEAIVVDYEIYDAVVTAEDAMAAGAPPVFDTKPNMGEPRVSTKGDLAKGFSEAKVVVERDYRTQVQTHSPMEPHGVVAQWDDTLRYLTVWISTQGTFGCRSDLAGHYGLADENVRVICDFIGGGFGSKIGVGSYGILAPDLAQMTGLPVKLMYDRKAEQLAAGNRPDSVQHLKIGARADGTISAIELTGYGTAGTGSGAGFASPAKGQYKVDNYSTSEIQVYTHCGPAASMRAPGHPQGTFPLESALDELAYALNMNPLDLRLVNDQYEARRKLWQLGAERFGWGSRNPTAGADPGRFKRGVGLASCTWTNGGFPGSIVRVTVSQTGSVLIENGVQDIGTGTRTWMAMLVAEELGLQVGQVQIKIGDTIFPYGTFSGGSTTTPSMAPPSRQAGELARQGIAAVVAPILNATPSELVFKGGMITAPNGASMTFAKGCSYLKSSLVVEGNRGDQAKVGNETTCGVAFAEVEVDTRTGKVKVLRVTAAHNAGRILNPLTAESQIIGGVIQGINYALFEERVMERNLGLMLNANLEFYKVGGSKDMPKIDALLLDWSSGGTYVGALGLGEPPIIATPAAIANAVYHAIGARVYQIPITPPGVLEALGTISSSRSARLSRKGVRR